MSTSPLTLLEAVNLVLRNDGEAPVSSLAEEGFSEAADALASIHEVSRAVQTEDWAFNTDFERKFIPDVEGEVVLPLNTLNIEPAYYSLGRRLSERAGKVYDNDENTFTFADPVYLNLRTCLEFDELPAAARHYIAVRAARVYQSRGTGSMTQDRFTAEDEMKARATLLKADSRTRARGVYRNPVNAYALRRRPL